MRLSLALFIVSALGLAGGIGWWVHPGAGIALGSLALGLFALYRDDGTITPQQKGRSR